MEKLWRPKKDATKFDNGQITIIGGSSLFHGAPILALKTASRLVDMVYFASPIEDKGVVDLLKSQLGAFIWIPMEDLSSYIKKSEVVLIGPGMMRYKKEAGLHTSDVCDDEGRITKRITEELLLEYPLKRWVIDGGSLQVMDAGLIPVGAVVTPNTKEFQMLFREHIGWDDLEMVVKKVEKQALKHECTIVLKGATTVVSDGKITWLVEGGSPGLTKGGTGDIVAGLTAALMAKNKTILAAAAANFLVKRAAEELEAERGTMFNADDVVEKIPVVWRKFVG